MKKITMFPLLVAICGSGMAFAKEVTPNYDVIRQKALTFESQLPVKVNSKLNQKNAPILVKVFENCIAHDRPSSFEVVSLVNEKGVVENAWSNTQTIFGQCAAKIFVAQQLEAIGNQKYYAILEFTLNR